MPKADAPGVRTHSYPGSDNSPGSNTAADASQRRILAPLLDNIPHPYASAPPVVADSHVEGPPQKKRKSTKKAKTDETDDEEKEKKPKKTSRNLFIHWRQLLNTVIIADESLIAQHNLSKFAGIAWKLLPKKLQDKAKESLDAALDRCEKETGTRSVVGTGMRFVDPLEREEVIPQSVYDEALVRLTERLAEEEAKAKAEAEAAEAARRAALEEKRARRNRKSKKVREPKAGEEPPPATAGILLVDDPLPAAEPGPSRKRRWSPSVSSSALSSNDEGRQRDFAPPRASPTPSLVSSRSGYAYTPSPPPPPTPPISGPAAHFAASAAAVGPQRPYPICDGPCAECHGYPTASAGHDAVHVAGPEPWTGHTYAPAAQPQVSYDGDSTAVYYTSGYAPSSATHYPVGDYASAHYTAVYYAADNVVPAGEATNYAPPFDAHVFGSPDFTHDFAFDPRAALPQFSAEATPQAIDDPAVYGNAALEQPASYGYASPEHVPEQPTSHGYASPEQATPHVYPDEVYPQPVPGAVDSPWQGDWTATAPRDGTLNVQSRLYEWLLYGGDVQALQELVDMAEGDDLSLALDAIQEAFDVGADYPVADNAAPTVMPCYQ